MLGGRHALASMGSRSVSPGKAIRKLQSIRAGPFPWQIRFPVRSTRIRLISLQKHDGSDQSLAARGLQIETLGDDFDTDPTHPSIPPP